MGSCSTAKILQNEHVPLAWRTWLTGKIFRILLIGISLVLVLQVASRALANGEIVVSDNSGLRKALENATGDEIIILDDGVYGSLKLRLQPASTVTIRAANPGTALFEEIKILGGGNLHFDGIRINDRFEVSKNASHVTLINSKIKGILYLKFASHINVEGNDVEGVFHASLFNSVQHFVVRNNVIHDAQVDLMRITGNSYEGIIENNYFLDMHPEDHRSEGKGYNHSDAIQMFGANGVTPHDIVIRGNHIYDDRSTGAPRVTPQGIFLSDPAGDGGYKNILIENNLISVGSSNSIYINGGNKNVVVRNNSLIPSKSDGGAVIRLAKKAGHDNSGTTVTGNVMKILKDETGQSTIGDNYIYGRKARLAALFSGDGSGWRDFMPVSGSPIDFGTGYGAYERLSVLNSK
jgi:hypothetical protein